MKNKELKFNTLKKSYKKQIIIGSVFICVIGSIVTFATTRSKYTLTESIPLVRGTVNYKVPDLRTVALYTANDSGTYVETNNIPTSGYQLNKTKSVCKVYDGTTSIENAPVDSSITIEYKGGQIYIGKLNKRNTRCYLYFDKQTSITINNIIEGLSVKVGTPDFRKTATTDEGVYATYDGMYGNQSYYWRGAVTNNYVSFANKCWRIIRINGDGSMRLFYDGTSCHANGITTADSTAVARIQYNSSYSQSNHVGWTYEGTNQRTTGGTSSNAKKQLESWYNTNLASYESKIADGKYCNDRNVKGGNTWTINGSTNFDYAATGRINIDYQPTLTCNTGDIYTLKVGLITADEVMYAGGNTTSNKSYYLYSYHSYWTMSPSYWYSSGNVGVFYVDSGLLSYVGVYYSLDLKPVINLHSDTTFKSGGNGTISNPYVVN